MGEWVPSEVMEARLLRLVEKGLLPPKEVARWRAAAGDVFPFDFHERGFMIPASDFFRGFLHEYGVQLQHLPPNAVLQLSGFIVIYEAFLGNEPNKDLFR
jgi:hypothetical protein